MAGIDILGLTEATEVNETNDYLAVVDKSDTTQDISGSTKKTTVRKLLGDKALPGGDFVGTTDTQTLTNKTLTSPIFTGDWNGWVGDGETWTYASATTFTISGDKTGKYQKGDKVKLTQTTDKYFRITNISYSSPNTTVTVDGFGIYTLANATITNPYYSKMDNPQGFPQKEVLLFSGTPAASITLSETSDHFDILDIWYEDSVGVPSSQPYYYTRFNTDLSNIFVIAVGMGLIDGSYKIRTSGAYIQRGGAALVMSPSGGNYFTETKNDSSVAFGASFSPKITRVIGIRW